MTIDFANYRVFVGDVVGPLRAASREAAQAHFDYVMESRSFRREELARLLARHQQPFGETDEDLQRINEFFLAAATSLHPLRELPPPWDSVVVDLAIFVGDEMIRRAGGAIGWSLYTSQPKATGYHRPVITGFSQAGSDQFYVDVAFLIASYLALAARRGSARPDYFVFMLRESLARV